MEMERPVRESERYWKAVKRIKRYAGRVVLLCAVIALIMVYLEADARYRRQKKEMYEKKSAVIEQAMAREKVWIHENAGEDGPIYLNSSNGAKDVNPYFSCQAGMGLLAGKPSREDFHAVAAYLNWHSRQIIEYEGIVSNYYTENGQLIPTGDYDSVDSYIAVYLTLLHTYEQKGGGLGKLTDWQEAVAVCAGHLQELEINGLTRVSEEYAVIYLMDNAEVWEACRGMGELLDSEKPEITGWEEVRELSAFFKRLKQQIEAAIPAKLWNETEHRYEIGLDESGRVLNFQDWQEFYPSAVAQIYPAAVGMEKKLALYGKLCETFEWEYLKIEDTTFEWPVLAYVGACLGDELRPEIYIEEFGKKFRENRKYPLHTASSGWVARACEQLLVLYEERADSGLLEDLFR